MHEHQTVDSSQTSGPLTKEYEKMTNAFNLLKLLAPAEEDLKEGRYTEAKDFFKEFKSAKKI